MDDDEDEPTIGRRVARARRRKGWSQQHLGDAIGRTSSWVSKIERGDLPLDRMSIVSRIADVLSVEVIELTGQPYRHRDRELESGHSSIPALRLALQHATLPVPVVASQTPFTPPDLSLIRVQVQECENLRQAARFNAVGELLPGIIEQLSRYVRDRPGAGAEWAEANELFLRACHIARVASNLLGHHDLAWTAVQLQAEAAERAQLPELQAAAAWDLCGAWLHVGALRDARTVALSLIDQLDAFAGSDNETLVALYGAMHLRAAVAYSRLWSTTDARNHLTIARTVSLRVSSPNVYQTMFNTLNVGIHAVEVEFELGHPVEALQRAELIDPTQIISAERQAHYWTIRAAGYAMNRKNDLAIRALLTADTIAPQHLRNRPLARELVRDLLDRERRRNTQLRGLASRMALE